MSENPAPTRTIAYPEALPVSARRADIMAAIAEHQVVVVAGETGSGKTTQIPKMCLELGLAAAGTIGHTQPRRLAARSVAERIAEELGEEIGQTVGYQVRFTSQVSERTEVKLMTDGILLAEIPHDPLLRRYSAIIIDEAHERSLNIDFILGYLKRILPQRPDLKIVITSATIDPERFARHFAPSFDPVAEHPEDEPMPDDAAPVIEVSGRTYPVEIRYRPLADPSGGSDEGTDDGLEDDDRDPIDAVCDAVLELRSEAPGDILVFFAGEREIRDAADALEDLARRDRRLTGTEILPLFARLSMAEHHRVFRPSGKPRIVLATNVAETSLTVPGIKYVIDPGTARISRYSTRTKVQRLPIERVSQASANQRSGRCGRVSDGIAIRLYSEEDFASRPEFTDPEILRTNLAAVILHTMSIGVVGSPADMERFPFVEPPAKRAVADGVAVLRELGALTDERGDGRSSSRGDGGPSGGGSTSRRADESTDQNGDDSTGRVDDSSGGRGDGSTSRGGDESSSGREAAGRGSGRGRRGRGRGRGRSGRGRGGAPSPLTDVGRKLAAFPVDPRLGRMIVAAQEHGVEREVMVLAAALTIQDPRERPADKRPQADEHHSRFRDDASDFSGYLLLWQYLQEKQRELSSSQFRKMCQREFINFLRVREWQDLYEQIRELGSRAGVPVARGRQIDPGQNEDAVHRSLLTGLLSHVGIRDERSREYLGARGTRFSIFPASGLFKKNPDWIVAAELVETSKLWARVNAAVKPEWIEEAAGHLLKRSYSEPHWSAKRGSVMAYEKATLFGVPVFTERLVNYWRIDPELSRELFIRRALVEGDWRTRHRFFQRNQRRLAEIDQLEARLRRRDLRVDDDALYAFYDARIPADVVSERHFDQWWKKTRPTQEHLLDFSPEALIDQEAADYDESSYPRTWVVDPGGSQLRLDLTYRFAPAAPGAQGTADGVFVQVPVVFLNQLEPTPFEWMIPGLRRELVTALIKSLPKASRKHFVPAPDVAAQALERLEADFDPAADELLPSLELALRRLKGVIVPPGSWNWDAVPAHLRVTFQVRDPRNKLLGEGKDLAELQERLRPQVRSALAASLGASPDALDRLASAGRTGGGPDGSGGSRASGGARRADGAGRAGGAHRRDVGPRRGRPARGQGRPRRRGQPAPAPARTATGPAGGGDSAAGVAEVSGLTAWPERDLPTKITRRIAGQQIEGFPALVDEGSTVAVRILASEAERARAQRGGVVRLLALKVPSPQKYVSQHLKNSEKIVFTQNPHGSVESLIADCTAAALDKLTPAQAPVRRADFDALFDAVRAELIDTVFSVTSLVAEILKEATAVRKQLKSSASLSVINAYNDIKAQVDQLVYPGFVAATGYDRLVHLPRYLRAARIRMDKIGERVNRDHQLMLEVQELEDRVDAAAEQHARDGVVPAGIVDAGWMVEELRVSHFAQELGTARTVSPQRIRKALSAAVAEAEAAR
ncbi:ATP-dependent RNA helicase HrpA [Rothia sp. AR01]|uniref:ATP-dependent RNA helicase HrpA n=1 Tax=Rothia santali TaxID=2949643 RepID=A0A9X2HJB2_9MICC|nr:ATP-dependent RNA helicase HrpA [Rothia santali]MCP3425943.1 ATP-dependent RNA helicase HrpA [Rothia santali]